MSSGEGGWRSWAVPLLALVLLVTGGVLGAGTVTGTDADADAAPDTDADTLRLRSSQGEGLRSGQAALSAGSNEHLWFVVEGPPRGERAARIALSHHAAGMDGPYHRPLIALSSVPRFLAAWGDTVWLLYQTPGQPAECFSSTVIHQPLTGSYYTDPPARLGVRPALPGTGAVRAFAANRSVAWAIVQADGPPPALLRLRGGQWDVVPWPAGIFPEPDETVAIGVAAADGRRLEVVWADESGRRVLRRAFADDEWSAASRLDGVGVPRRLVRAGNATYLIHETDGVLFASLLRATQVGAAVELGPVSEFGSVTALGDRLAVLVIPPPEDPSSGDVPELTLIDPRGGARGATMTLGPQPYDRLALLRGPVVVAVVFFAFVLFMALRPRMAEDVAFGTGHVLAAPSRRLVAALIDLAPGLLLGSWFFEASLVETLGTPLLLTGTSAGFATWTFAVALATLHGVITAMTARRSIGAIVVGHSAVHAGSAPLSGREAVLRAVTRSVVLMLPILGITMVQSPTRQTLHDLVVRSFVVARGEAQESRN